MDNNLVIIREPISKDINVILKERNENYKNKILELLQLEIKKVIDNILEGKNAIIVGKISHLISKIINNENFCDEEVNEFLIDVKTIRENIFFEYNKKIQEIINNGIGLIIPSELNKIQEIISKENEIKKLLEDLQLQKKDIEDNASKIISYIPLGVADNEKEVDFVKEDKNEDEEKKEKLTKLYYENDEIGLKILTKYKEKGGFNIFSDHFSDEELFNDIVDMYKKELKNNIYSMIALIDDIDILDIKSEQILLNIYLYFRSVNGTKFLNEIGINIQGNKINIEQYIENFQNKTLLKEKIDPLIKKIIKLLFIKKKLQLNNIDRVNLLKVFFDIFGYEISITSKKVENLVQKLPNKDAHNLFILGGNIIEIFKKNYKLDNLKSLSKEFLEKNSIRIYENDDLLDNSGDIFTGLILKYNKKKIEPKNKEADEEIKREQINAKEMSYEDKMHYAEMFIEDFLSRKMKLEIVYMPTEDIINEFEKECILHKDLIDLDIVKSIFNLALTERISKILKNFINEVTSYFFGENYNQTIIDIVKNLDLVLLNLFCYTYFKQNNIIKENPIFENQCVGYFKSDLDDFSINLSDFVKRNLVKKEMVVDMHFSGTDGDGGLANILSKSYNRYISFIQDNIQNITKLEEINKVFYPSKDDLALTGSGKTDIKKIIDTFIFSDKNFFEIWDLLFEEFKKLNGKFSGMTKHYLEEIKVIQIQLENDLRSIISKYEILTNFMKSEDMN